MVRWRSLLCRLTRPTATGYNSQLLKLLTSAYNSTSKTIVNPRFVWQATVNGNNTAAPSATLELLSSTTDAVATPTGFYFNPNGTINFAPGQTFPGAGVTGTVYRDIGQRQRLQPPEAHSQPRPTKAHLKRQNTLPELINGSASDSNRFSDQRLWMGLAVPSGRRDLQ